MADNNNNNNTTIPRIIALEESKDLWCPNHHNKSTASPSLNKIIYFSRQLHLDSDEEGEPLKEEYICLECGYNPIFYSPKLLQELKDEVSQAQSKKAELYQLRDKLKDSRVNHIRLREKEAKKNDIA